MYKAILTACALIGTAGAGIGAAQAATIYGVDENNNLVTFDSANPGTMLSTVSITGTDAGLGAIDFRPFDRMLYGLGLDRVVYRIDMNTGAATAVSGVLALNGTSFAFDFNPTIDRLRIVSNLNDNYVVNPNNGVLTIATSVFYAAGDPNNGTDPDVTAGAYTSSIFGAPGSSTQLYSIDTALDVLAKQANSAGILTTVGALGIDVGSRTSFDIFGSDAFAFNGSRLYRVNLATGALTSLGMTDRALFGIAIAPVPEPASWMMMIGGMTLVGGAMRKRRKTIRFA
ncbi:hypothetical protein FHS91_000136 [Sphingobium xanthum]|uniref:DUF4394 domain-containing protein n=1 Tax=Sphingobium xanthum TaxID=1387165 RepID=UPI001C8B578B|nr:DUF4394 domain-containing protein [Sphingobium xanthum]